MNRGWRLAEVSRDEEKEAEKLRRVLFVKEREEGAAGDQDDSCKREREKERERCVCEKIREEKNK